MTAGALLNGPEPGKTYYNGGTIDASPYGTEVDLEGTVRTFKNRFSPNDGTAANAANVISPRNAGDTTRILVRNVSALALLPGRMVRWAAGYMGTRVDGYTAVTDAACAGIIDDNLPAAGCPIGDLCWITVDGPSLWRTDIANGAGNSIAEGDWLGALTGATSGATTSGRLAAIVTTGYTTPQFNAVMNRVGRAMSANTTNQTNRMLLVDVQLRH